MVNDNAQPLHEHWYLNPDILLMDEPFSALDAPTRENLETLTLTLSEEADLTVVLVTHSIEEATFVGQHILVLNIRLTAKQ